MTQRIVITGLGVLAPIGSGYPEFWQALIAGKVGTGPIQAFDTSMFEAHIGGEVQNFDPTRYFNKIDPNICGRTTQLAVAAARMAVDDAEVLGANYDPARIGVCMGTTMGNASVGEDENTRRLQGQPAQSATLSSHYAETYITAAIAQELEIEGPCHVIPTACAAGNYAIGWGMDLIRDELVDVAIVGGADALSRGCFAVFHRLGGMAHDVCQPFDRNRTGMLVSEGAGVLVLENYERAVKRGAKIYAELLGYGLACDAHHPTAPHPDGIGAQASMRRSLEEANLDLEKISYISAHGTGTRANDSSESLAVRKVFGPLADSLPVSSIKSMLGHTMGAASAIEAVACALIIGANIIPPTANYRDPDPECLQMVVPNQAQESRVDVAMSNSFAFGGKYLDNRYEEGIAMAKYDGPIVITAMGAISPFGQGVEPIWSALLQGERRANRLDVVWSALQEKERPSPPAEPGVAPLWGMQVGDCQLPSLLGKRGFQYWRPGTQFLLGASVLAMQEAGLANEGVDPDELGITVGSNLAGFQSMVDYDYTAITEGPHYTSPMEAPNTLANAPASHLAIRLKARALNTTIASGQCSGLDALGYGAKMVRDGRARQIVAGGVEELSPAALWVYLNAQALTRGCSEDAGRPFAEESTGWLPSEGAAVVILEKKTDALQRGARPLAELAGWSSAFAPSAAPEKRAAVLRRAAQQALDAAGISAEQIDVVVAGASGLHQQDQAEALALRELLAQNTHASVTAIKGTLGESYGASGLFQALAAVCMISHGQIPPTSGGTRQTRATSPGGRLHTEVRSWPESKQGTVLLLAQDLFGSTSAVVLRGCQN